MANNKKVLVIGGGAREHAIIDALIAGDAQVYCYMPLLNPGIARTVIGYFIGKLDNTKAAVAFAKSNGIELAVVGPEAPLAAGIADELREAGIGCVGPTKALAQLETSKSFTRTLLQKYNIDASPRLKIFDQENASLIPDFLKELGRYAIKPDGLTGGKGVKVLGDHLQNDEEALEYCNQILASQHATLLIEERLEGEEFSLQTLTDGASFVHFPPVQDHKRAFEHDKGPNTGGMGSYSDANFLLPFLTPADVKEAQQITEQVAAALREEIGEGYKGIMYGGFMKTANGIKVIEYNARFGDPEAMNVLPLLKTNFVDLCTAVTEGNLGALTVEFEPKATVCKYIVPEGYPDHPQPGRIELPDLKEDTLNALIYYASVEEKEGELYTTNSRSIAFVGIAETIKKAEKIAEQAASKVNGKVYHRKDIGTIELLEKRMEHIRKLLTQEQEEEEEDSEDE